MLNDWCDMTVKLLKAALSLIITTVTSLYSCTHFCMASLYCTIIQHVENNYNFTLKNLLVKMFK